VGKSMASPDEGEKLMKNRHTPGNGWLVRFMRGRRFDDNPLRRHSDRAETVILGGLLAALLAGGPFAMLAGGDFVHGLASHAQQSQLAGERYVTAVTTQAAPPAGTTRDLGMISYPVLARWTAPNGKAAAGEIPVPLATPAGSHEHLWVTLDGKLGVQPLQDSQVASLTTLGETASLVALVLVLAAARGVARHELDRRRFAAWEADWRAIDPRAQRK
jgi:hypothetical protein